jgi:HEAT repeat protein
VCAAAAAAGPAFAAPPAPPAAPARPERVLIDRLAADPDPRARAVAADFLGGFNPADGEVVAALGKALAGDADARVRERAARSLGTVGPRAREAAPALTRALASDADAFVRTAAARSLGRLGPCEELQAAVPVLARAASLDEDFTVQAAAGESLQENAAVAVPALVEGLKAASPEDRRAAAFGLAVIGPKARDAAGALEQLSRSDPDAAVRQAAAQARRAILNAENP